MNYSFPEECSNWAETPLDKLFEVDLERKINSEYSGIQNNLEVLSRNAEKLILWLDWDREGEGISFEVLDVIQSNNPKIEYLRAKFSAVTPDDIWNAMKTLGPPNRNLALAVETRQEIDLRIGASFTRFQTLNFSDLIKRSGLVLSYGPCQFPTLGFVVDRYKEIKEFVPEIYWSLSITQKFPADKNKI